MELIPEFYKQIFIKRRRIPVWVYHNVAPVKPGSAPGLTIEPGVFKNQIKLLKSKRYNPISIQSWINWIKDGITLPPKPILITFDDAYFDITKYALPILEKYGFNSLIFVVTDLIGKTNIWDNKLGWNSLPLMGEDDIVKWSKRRVEFGAHTCSHLSLTEATDSVLYTEIFACGDKLESIIGKPIYSFAYPYGNLNNKISDLVNKQYMLGFSIREGVNTSKTEQSVLKRTTLLPWDSNFDLFFRAHFGYSPIKRLRTAVRLRTRLKEFIINVSHGRWKDIPHFWQKL